MHIFMKFWKHLLFVYFFISFEFSLDDFLGSLITNESENHFNIINIILFYVEVFLPNSEILIHSPNLQRRLFGKGYYTQQEYHILYNQIFFSVFFLLLQKFWTSQILVKVLVKSNFLNFVILLSVLLVLRKIFHWY